MEPSYYQKEYWRKSGINESDVIVLLMEWEHSYQKDCHQPETSPSRNPPSVAAACLLACLHACRLGTILQYLALIFSGLGFVPSGLGFRSNGTLLICMPWIIIKWDTSDSFPKSTPSHWYCLPLH